MNLLPAVVPATGRVLVASANPLTLTFVRDLLDAARHQVLTAERGWEAFASCIWNGPDLIVLDAHLRGVDAYAACQRLRNDPRTALTPIVFIASGDHPSEATFALEAGADACLMKPLAPIEILAAVERLLREKLSLLRGQQGRSGARLAAAAG